MKQFEELTLEELMEIAKKPIKNDKFKALPPAKRFLMSEGIVVGTEKIPAILIYDRYEKWAKAFKVKAVTQQTFFKELAKYHDKTKLANGYAYLMNPKGFNLSPEYLAIVKEIYKPGRRNSRNDETKEKRQTKKSRQATPDENT